MYFVELIIKKLTKKKETKDYNPTAAENEDYECCEHIFMPLDSTEQILSCTKCGLVVKRSELKNKNFFENKGTL